RLRLADLSQRLVEGRRDLDGGCAAASDRLALGVGDFCDARPVAAPLAQAVAKGGARRRPAPGDVALADGAGPRCDGGAFGRLAGGTVAGGMAAGASGSRFGIFDRTGAGARG